MAHLMRLGHCWQWNHSSCRRYDNNVSHCVYRSLQSVKNFNTDSNISQF